MQTPFFPVSDAYRILEWLHDAGVTEWIGESPYHLVQDAVQVAPAKSLTNQNLSTSASASGRVAPLTAPSAGSRSWAETLAALTDRQNLNEWLKQFREISLCRTATQAVVGQFLADDGEGQPLIMVIAEAPDAVEDQNGQTFSGPAHDLLRQALRYSPVPANRIYLTYLSKWRPPGQRSLSLPELELAQAILAHEIALIAPNGFITLGDAVPRALSKIADQFVMEDASDDSAGARVPSGTSRSRVLPEKFYNIVFKGKKDVNRALSLQKAETMLKDGLTKKRVWQGILSFCQALPTS